jgi:hypothetical protein
MPHPRRPVQEFGGQTATDSPTLFLSQHLCHLEELSSANSKLPKENSQQNKKNMRGASSTQELNTTAGVLETSTQSQFVLVGKEKSNETTSTNHPER